MSDTRPGYLSLYAGMGGIDRALDQAGWRALGQVEIDGSANKVLAKHWPGVWRAGDIREVAADDIPERGSVQLLCGGFPCQDISVAGNRAGLAGGRSGLWSEFHRLIGELTPAWVLIENVYGLLFSQKGRDMATIVRALGDCGYGWAYRVLDSQYWGVPQRRRRVVIVGCLGSARRAAQVLFEPESLPRHPPQGRTKREDLAGTLGGGIARSSDPGGGGLRNDLDRMTYVAHTLRPGDRRAADDRTYVMAHATGQGWWEEGPGTVSASDARHDNNLVYSLQDGAANQEKGQNGLGVGDDGVMYTLDAKGKHAVAFDWQSGGDVRLHVSEERTSPLQGKQTPAVAFTERTRREGRNFESQEELAYALMNPGSGGRTHSRQVLAFMENQRAEVRETEQAQTLSNGGGKPGQGYPAVRDGMAVRRLMPVECLRLQGFPDDYLDGVGLSDTEAYRLIGNSVTVPVFRWVAERLRKVLEESS